MTQNTLICFFMKCMLFICVSYFLESSRLTLPLKTITLECLQRCCALDLLLIQW